MRTKSEVQKLLQAMMVHTPTHARLDLTTGTADATYRATFHTLKPDALDCSSACRAWLILDFSRPGIARV